MPNRKDGWWKRRTKLERQLLTFAFGTLFLAGILLICLIFYKQYQADNAVCLTKGCIHAASSILTNIDEAMDPCENFYQFACGNYIKNAVIEDDRPTFSVFTEMKDTLVKQIRAAIEEPSDAIDIRPFKILKKFYKICTNTTKLELDGIKDLLKLLHEIGGWPVLEENWDEAVYDWIFLIELLTMKGLTARSFLEVSHCLDFKNTTQEVLCIDQPKLGLSREFLVNGKNDPRVKAYYSFMVDIGILLGGNDFKVTNELEDVLKMEIELANITQPEEQRRNATALYNMMNLTQLEKNYKTIPWQELLTSFIPIDINVTSDQPILVLSPFYLERFEKVLVKNSARIRANYLIWRAIKELVPYLTERFLERELKFNHAINGVLVNPPRWKYCIDRIIPQATISAGALYVRKYFDRDSRRLASEIVHNLQDELRNNLEKLDWMDEKTRSRALEKARGFVNHIAYPDELFDDSKIEEYYRELNADSDQFLSIHLSFNTFINKKDFRKILEPVNKTLWVDHSNSAEVNAFYSFFENSIVLPAGILQGNFFNKNRPRYMNYGGIGFAVGHEMTHGFDDMGRQFDKDGNLVGWWQEKTKEQFLIRAKCIINQYNRYNVSEVNMTINGVKTQGENIADYGGIKEAYLAYRTWVRKNGAEETLPGLPYSPFQLFWISATQSWCSKSRAKFLALQVLTDPHSPDEFRIIGALSNSEYFSRDFKCPVGSRMNPKQKCGIW